MPADHDYTRDGQMVDQNYEMASFVPDKSADEIEKENTFRTPEPGDHLFVVQSYEMQNPVQVRVQVDGQPALFDSASVKVRFALADDANCTIDDYFTLPPGNPRQHPAYLRGQVMDGDRPSWGGAGREANKLSHFLSAVGFSCLRGQPLPKDACLLANWIGRQVVATVNAPRPRNDPSGRPMVDDKGRSVMGRARIKMFGYRLAAAGAASPGGNSYRPTPARPAAAAAVPAGALDSI